MRLHGNAHTCLHGRRLLVERVLEQGWTLTRRPRPPGQRAHCLEVGCSFPGEGADELLDRSSAPLVVPGRTPQERVELVAALRRLRMTAAEIAETLATPLSTVSAVLHRVGMGRLGRLGRLGLEQPVRYERSRPGELVHVDVKKLGRIEGGAGWRVRGGAKHYNGTFTDRDGHRRKTVGYEYVHIAVDDFSRLAYAEVLPDEQATTAVGFLRRAVAFYRHHGIRAQGLGLAHHVLDGMLLGAAQGLFIAAGAPADHVAHPREDVAEHVGADDGVARDDAQVLDDPAALDSVGGDDQHRILSVCLNGKAEPTLLEPLSESC